MTERLHLTAILVAALGMASDGDALGAWAGA